jgi:glycosyltransferase involved in cell wall biosynthesis
MNKDKFPKILFVETLLSESNSTGITLSNLFANWPKSALYFVSTTSNDNSSNDNSNYYYLGDSELKHRYPFLIFKWLKSFFVGSIHKKRNNAVQNQIVLNNNNNNNRFLTFSKKVLKFTFKVIGFQHFSIRCKVSTQLNDWIKFIQPDMIYCAVSTRHVISLLSELHNLYNLPIYIHIMDDWLESIGKDSIFAFYLNKKINNEFNDLLRITKKNIAISSYMAYEYKKRFKTEWIFFNNPVNIENWGLKYVPNRLTGSKYKVGYFGSIGNHNFDSIMFFIKLVNSSELKNFLEIHFYTQNLSDNFNNTFFHPFLSYNEIPKAISEYDFLILPLSFKKSNEKFIKYSMPTKLTEYLASSVPVILISPQNIAVTEFVKENECGFIIDNLDYQRSLKSLFEFINDINLQSLYIKNGTKLVEKLFDSRVVREALLSEILN